MGEENMVDQRQLGQRKFTHPGTGVDEDVVVEQHRRRAQMPAADTAAASQDPQFHAVIAAFISSRTWSPRPSLRQEGRYGILPPDRHKVRIKSAPVPTSSG